MSFSTAFDIVLAGLLVATLVYMVRLNRRIEVLRNARSEFEDLIGRFVESTVQAEQSMSELKLVATERGHVLQEIVGRATVLRDDLALLAHRATRLSDQLEGAVTRSRPAGKPTLAAPIQPTRSEEEPKPRSREDRELLKALSSIR